MSEDRIDFTETNRRRDARLRCKLLSTLYLARTGPQSGLMGRTLMELVDCAMPSAGQHEGDDHCIGLLRDLAAKGMVTEEDRRVRKSQRFSLDFMFLKITGKGSSFVWETSPPDADIDDGRIVK